MFLTLLDQEISRKFRSTCLNFGVIAKAFEPPNISFRTEPGALPFGVLPGFSLTIFQRFADISVLDDDIHCLLVTQRLQRLRIGGKARFQNSFSFMNKPILEHSYNPPVQALIQRTPIRSQS